MYFQVGALEVEFLSSELILLFTSTNLTWNRTFNYRIPECHFCQKRGVFVWERGGESNLKEISSRVRWSKCWIVEDERTTLWKTAYYLFWVSLPIKVLYSEQKVKGNNDLICSMLQGDLKLWKWLESFRSMYFHIQGFQFHVII